MNKFLLSLIFIFQSFISDAQNLTGQWKGGFFDKSVSSLSWGGDRCDYVLDLDVKGKNVTGFSYTYFTDEGKKYYTICRLTGIADRNKKYIEVTETERTKTNVPNNISNSFQLHKLTWRKEGDNEILEGTWIPASGQDRTGMGYGTTSLAKRRLTEILPLVKRINVRKYPVAIPANRNAAFAKSKTVLPPKKTGISPVRKPAKDIPPVVRKINTPIKKDSAATVKYDTAYKTIVKTSSSPQKDKSLPADFEKRNNALLQTVIVENPSVNIELYDNGEVDGDSISLFYNGRVLLAHKRLSETAILLNLPISPDDENELVMYADNLGSLPPNTALMIVRDGSKRYEVRITSDLKKSGTIRFVHKKPGAN